MRSGTWAGPMDLDPPQNALVLSIDEKTSFQARGLARPDTLPAPGTPARRDYGRRSSPADVTRWSHGRTTSTSPTCCRTPSRTLSIPTTMPGSRRRPTTAASSPSGSRAAIRTSQGALHRRVGLARGEKRLRASARTKTAPTGAVKAARADERSIGLLWRAAVVSHAMRREMHARVAALEAGADRVSSKTGENHAA
jgi:hypothetical protein